MINFLKNNWFRITISMLLLMIFISIQYGTSDISNTNKNMVQSNQISPVLNSSQVVNTNTKKTSDKLYDKKYVLDYYNNVKNSLPKHDFYCISDTKVICEEDKCMSTSNTVFNIIGPGSSGGDSVYRCDDLNPCDEYRVSSFREIVDGFTLYEMENPRMSFNTQLIETGIRFNEDTGIKSRGMCFEYKK